MDTTFLADFRQTVDSAADRLLNLSDDEAASRPAPGKWSRKEIIGHLIDSASNNHGRFVRAQLQDDLMFAGYDQDAWVRAQAYQDRRGRISSGSGRRSTTTSPHVMETADPNAVTRPRARHNLNLLAWRSVSAG